MNTIYKYEIPINADDFPQQMPSGAKVVHVGLDPKGRPCFWALVVTSRKSEERWFSVRLTGETFDIGRLDPIDPIEDAYLGTIHYENLILHLFEST